MTSDDFIDQLERELRTAARRRVRLELARVPRLPAGLGVLVVAAVIAAAVAVPVLAAHSGSQATRPAGYTPVGGSVVVGCGHTVSGRLPADWRSPRAGTVVTGPIAWVFLSQDAPHAVITHTQLIEALAVVDPGRDVTASVPRGERVSLDYTDVSPRSRFRLSQGVSSVTFRPCSGPLGQTQFLGGFIIPRPECVTVIVSGGRSGSPTPYSIPLGRSCNPSRVPPDNILKGNGVGQAHFGEGLKTVIRKLRGTVGRPTRRHFGRAFCGIDGEVDWPGLAAYFRHRRFVGYSYGPKMSDGGVSGFGTVRGLRVGETVREARRFYGSAFKVSAAQGGSWLVRTAHGRIDGFLSDITNPRGEILTIEAGYVGCPALTP